VVGLPLFGEPAAQFDPMRVNWLGAQTRDIGS